MYKFSNYNLWFPYSNNDNYLLGYNYVKETLIILSKKDKTNLEMLISSKKDKEDKNRGAFQSLKKLEELGFLVKDDVDEKEVIEKVFKKGKFTNDRLYFVIAYTTKCNMECVYCFQQHIKGVQMNNFTKEKTLNWLERYLDSNKSIRNISLNLFGGEPLVDLESFNFFIDRVRKISIQRELSFGFSLTTNGVLIEKINLNNLILNGLKGIQFTLDGPRKIHDKRRLFKNKSGSFNKIIQAIKKISDLSCKVEIIVEVNFDKQNILSLSELFDEFIKNGIDKKIIVSPEPVLPAAKKNLSSHYEVYKLNEQELIEAYKHILQEINKRNLKVSKTLGRFYPCTFTHKNNIIIGPDGKIYKCAFMMGFNVFSVGEVINEGYNSIHDELSQISFPAKCYECKFLPICGGGCKYKSYLKYGDFKKVYCEKRLLEEIQPKIIECVYQDRIRSICREKDANIFTDSSIKE